MAAAIDDMRFGLLVVERDVERGAFDSRRSHTFGALLPGEFLHISLGR